MYNYESSLDLSSMYGLWSMDQKNYSVYIRGDSGTYDNLSADFIGAASRLPGWDKDDSPVRTTFERFFATWGTHVIKDATGKLVFSFELRKKTRVRSLRKTFPFRSRLDTRILSLAVRGSTSRRKRKDI